MEKNAEDLEIKFVHNVYERIAPHFSDTRYKAWPKVRQFIDTLPAGSLIADIGCGNGKYFGFIPPSSFIIGCDVCKDLLQIAKGKSHFADAIGGQNLALPFRDRIFDAIISIAVIHHFSTLERRIRAVKELERCLKPGGRLMIYVWAMEQTKREFCAQDVLVPWHMQPQYLKGETASIDSQDCCSQDRTIPVSGNYTKTSTQTESPAQPLVQRVSNWLKLAISSAGGASSPGGATSGTANWTRERRHSTPEVEQKPFLSVPPNGFAARLARFSPLLSRKLRLVVEENLETKQMRFADELARKILDETIREFVNSRNAQDENLETSSNGNDQTFYRYYHVFKKGELEESLIAEIPRLCIEDSYYDHANWCVICVKKQQ